MKKVVKLDLLGCRRLEFGAFSVAYHATERKRASLWGTKVAVAKQRIPYAEICQAGPVSRHPWLALTLAVTGGACSGLLAAELMLYQSVATLPWSLWLVPGALWLGACIAGRRDCLAIISKRQTIWFPIGHHQKQVNKALRLLEAFREDPGAALAARRLEESASKMDLPPRSQPTRAAFHYLANKCQQHVACAPAARKSASKKAKSSPVAGRSSECAPVLSRYRPCTDERVKLLARLMVRFAERQAVRSY